MTDRVKELGGFHVTPVPTIHTTHEVENGWMGLKPLPVVGLSDDMMVSVWVIPEEALHAWLERPHALQLVHNIKDNSVSMTKQ